MEKEIHYSYLCTILVYSCCSYSSWLCGPTLRAPTWRVGVSAASSKSSSTLCRKNWWLKLMNVIESHIQSWSSACLRTANKVSFSIYIDNDNWTNAPGLSGNTNTCSVLELKTDQVSNIYIIYFVLYHIAKHHSYTLPIHLPLKPGAFVPICHDLWLIARQFVFLLSIVTLCSHYNTYEDSYGYWNTLLMSNFSPAQVATQGLVLFTTHFSSGFGWPVKLPFTSKCWL